MLVLTSCRNGKREVEFQSSTVIYESSKIHLIVTDKSECLDKVNSEIRFDDSLILKLDSIPRNSPSLDLDNVLPGWHEINISALDGKLSETKSVFTPDTSDNYWLWIAYFHSPNRRQKEQYYLEKFLWVNRNRSNPLPLDRLIKYSKLYGDSMEVDPKCEINLTLPPMLE